MWVGTRFVTRTSSPTRLFAGVEQNEFVYYTHSYFVPTTISHNGQAQAVDPVAAGTTTSRRSPRRWSTRT